MEAEDRNWSNFQLVEFGHGQPFKTVVLWTECCLLGNRAWSIELKEKNNSFRPIVCYKQTRKKRRSLNGDRYENAVVLNKNLFKKKIVRYWFVAYRGIKTV